MRVINGDSGALSVKRKISAKALFIKTGISIAVSRGFIVTPTKRARVRLLMSTYFGRLFSGIPSVRMIPNIVSGSVNQMASKNSDRKSQKATSGQPRAKIMAVKPPLITSFCVGRPWLPGALGMKKWIRYQGHPI